MKPRTVILTLELPNCEVPLAGFRKARAVGLWDEKRQPIYHVLDGAQATATVAQPSGTAAKRARIRREDARNLQRAIDTAMRIEGAVRKPARKAKQ